MCRVFKTISLFYLLQDVLRERILKPPGVKDELLVSKTDIMKQISNYFRETFWNLLIDEAQYVLEKCRIVLAFFDFEKKAVSCSSYEWDNF